MSNEWWVTVHESIRRAHRRTIEDATWILRKTIHHLLPDLCEASKQGHTVTLKTDAPKWALTLADVGPKIELDELMEAWEICVGATL